MDVTLAPTYLIPTRRVRRARAGAPAAPQTDLVRTLPMRAAVGVRVSAPNWMWILGGAVVGGLLLGPIGAVAGGLAGAYLLR